MNKGQNRCLKSTVRVPYIRFRVEQYFCLKNVLRGDCFTFGSTYWFVNNNNKRQTIRLFRVRLLKI